MKPSATMSLTFKVWAMDCQVDCKLFNIRSDISPISCIENLPNFWTRFKPTFLDWNKSELHWTEINPFFWFENNPNIWSIFNPYFRIEMSGGLCHMTKDG